MFFPWGLSQVAVGGAVCVLRDKVCGYLGVYPELSGASAEVNSVVTALMSVATAVFVCVCCVTDVYSEFSFGSAWIGGTACGVCSGSASASGRDDPGRCGVWCGYGGGAELSCGDEKTAGCDERDI